MIHVLMLATIWHEIARWFAYNYLPTHGPFWTAAIWGNVFVILVLAPLGWLWSKTKFWPLLPMKHATDQLHKKLDHLHDKHDFLAEEIAKLHERHDTSEAHQANHAEALEKIVKRLDDLQKQQSPDS